MAQPAQKKAKVERTFLFSSESVNEGLETLAGNMGMDVPDSVGDVLPYVGEVLLGLKLLKDVIATERDLSEVDFGERGRVHVVRALLVISRFGIASTCAMVFGAAGTAVMPGVGSVIGGLGGVGMGMFLNKHVKGRVGQLAHRVAGLSEEDMFYLSHKRALDEIGNSFARIEVAKSGVA